MKNKHLLIILIASIPISLFLYSGYLELRAEEPRRAIVAMEMLLNNKYISPQINGMDYYNKPPFYNWVLALFFKITGSYSEWVVRLPGILSLLLTALLTYFVVRKYVNNSTAIYSTLFFITSGDLYFYGAMNAGEIDFFYTLLVYAQAISIFVFYRSERPLLLFTTSYLLTAIGMLTKGAPSIVFQGVTLVAYLLIVKRDWKLFFSWKHLLGILVCIVPVIFYFYRYEQLGSDSMAYITNLFNEASGKTGFESKTAGLAKNLLVFPLNFLKLMLPWSVIILLFFDKNILRFIKSNDYVLFAAVFIVCNIPLYWFTEKLTNRYVYMFIPFFLTIAAFRYDSNKSLFPNFNKLFNGFISLLIILLTLSSLGLLFIDEFSYIEHYSLKVFIIISLILTAAFFNFRPNLDRMYVVAFAVISLRITMTLIYYPYLDQNQEISYREMAKNLLEKSNNEPILQGGFQFSFESKIAVGDIVFKRDTLKTAPLIAYQIPYYLTLNTNTIMQYEKELMPDHFYLIYSQHVDTSKVIVLSEVKEGWQPSLKLSLVKPK